MNGRFQAAYIDCILVSILLLIVIMDVLDSAVLGTALGTDDADDVVVRLCSWYSFISDLYDKVKAK